MRSRDALARAITALISDRFGVLPDDEGISDVELDAAERALKAPLPQSYRTFLRYFGASPRAPLFLFGLPRHRTWGDIVLMNGLDSPVAARRFVKFAEATGRAYYFDTDQMDSRGECPVALRVAGSCAVVVARDFADFISRVECERPIFDSAPGKNCSPALGCNPPN